VLAVLVLVPAALSLLSDAPQLGVQRQHLDLMDLLEHRTIWLAGLVFFFYAPLEGAVSIWTTTYLTDMGHGERSAVWMLTGFWGMFLASRLGIALLQHSGYLSPAWDGWVLVGPSLLAAVVLGNLSGSASRAGSRSGLLLLGALLGPIFPTLLGMVFRDFPNSLGTAYGTVFALGATGSLVLGPILGASARRRTVRSAFRIQMVLGLALATAALAFNLVR
jgi:fucose permease